jgi:Fe-S cluster biogenesis protein NfuA
LRPLVTRLINIKSTLKDGTPSTFFREITEFKGKVLVDVIGACSPLGIITGGKIEF